MQPIIEKSASRQNEMLYSDDMKQKARNIHFGFRCVHYNVMESQRVLAIEIENRLGE